MVPPPQIDTPRLRLLAPEPALADTVAEFYRRNKDHFARWDPPHPPGFLTAAFHQAKLEAGAAAFRAGRDWRYWLTLRGDPETAPRVIGQCHVSSVVRGTFHSANLGYALDHAHQGSGLMFEAVSTLIDEAMFAPGVNLHRLQAGHLPQNQRSGRLLHRLGFTQIGIAHDYLFIDGAWRDHLLWQRINRAACGRRAAGWNANCHQGNPCRSSSTTPSSRRGTLKRPRHFWPTFSASMHPPDSAPSMALKPPMA